MLLLSHHFLCLRFTFATLKVHYPFFLAEDYTQLQYSPYYAQQALKLKIDKPNMYQAGYEYLEKFLSRQIEQDKSLFIKDKEIAFVGRSNSGKSSLINAIFNEKKVARVAKHPGTTKNLHFHRIKNAQCFVVDAPGYGFARMNKRRRQMWFGLTEDYLKISSRVSQIFLCINFEHGLKENDKLFLQRTDKFNLKIQVILTKVDKVNPKKYFASLQSIVQELKRLQLTNLDVRVIACSVKNHFGIQFVKMRMVEAIERSQQRDIDNNEDLLLSYLKQMRVAPTVIEETQTQQSKEYLVRKLIYNSKLTRFLA